MPAVASPKRRSLAPREHGAYAQLGLPLAAACAGGRPGAAACLFGLAAVMAFLAHEPLVVLLGHRGQRARVEAGARAWRRMVGVVLVGAVSGGVAAYLAPAAAALGLLPAGVAAAVGMYIRGRRERTLTAEVLAGTALAGASLPVAFSAGWPLAAALSAFAGWSAGFAAITFAVWPIAHKRTLGPGARTLSLLLPALVVSAAALGLGPQAAASGGPLVLAAAATAALRPPARLLRKVGWTVAAASLVQAAAVVALGPSIWGA